jgi:hypothetical protein
MVREVKFSCDVSEGIEMPPVRDRFDDGDDQLLDGFAEETAASRHRPRRPAAAGRGARHLAGADWIDAVPLPRQSGRAVQG